MEHLVDQRSKEWFRLRRNKVLTASRFGDAIGLGVGKPYDFFRSLLSDDDEPWEGNEYMKHGTETEPIIREAYELLTGYDVRESGFWTYTSNQDGLKDLIGASPDAIVKNPDTGKPLGLCEYKAPVHKMYGQGSGDLRGIPRKYMAQMQGQLAVSGLQWCDFMAVCMATREIILKRIFFHPLYWQHVSKKLKEFCFTVLEAKESLCQSKDPDSLDSVQKLKCWSCPKGPLPGEQHIFMLNLLRVDPEGRFCGPSGHWLTFEVLVGMEVKLSAHLECYALKMLEKIDDEIEDKEIERQMAKCEY